MHGRDEAPRRERSAGELLTTTTSPDLTRRVHRTRTISSHALPVTCDERGGRATVSGQIAAVSPLDADLGWHLFRYAIATVTLALSFIRATTSSVEQSERTRWRAEDKSYNFTRFDQFGETVFWPCRFLPETPDFGLHVVPNSG